MKMIDIHTKKESLDNNRYTNPIKPELVKAYVFQNIDFPLTNEHWEIIEDTFAEIWNNKLGIGGEFFNDDVPNWVFKEIQSQKIIIEFERIEKIISLMLTYIENSGGFLDEG